MILLGIETSCDETSAAIVEYRRGRFTVHANVVSSQIALHAMTGGVVPEVAAREHCLTIVPVLKEVFSKAHAARTAIDAIAVTSGPGLITSLIVGVEAARSLAYTWDLPLIPVNHIAGHVASNWLSNEPIRFPALCLVVSGGHTELLLMPRQGVFHCIGRTLDDAVGEAFDKVAKLLGLGYPGGPVIAKLAERGDPKRYRLPRPMLGRKGFDFSFAGIKTAVLYLVEGVPGKAARKPRINVPDLAASFQQAAIDVLVGKTLRAGREHGVRSILLGGGVAANRELRRQLEIAVRGQLPTASYHQPLLAYCTDNAAMIAAAGAFAYRPERRYPWARPAADPNWELWGQKSGAAVGNSAEVRR